MTFKDSIQICFKKYADFTGTASRSEYWWFFLFVVIANLVSGYVGLAVNALFSLATFVPSVAVAARRLHDTDRSGWWQLLGLIPLVGWVVLIVFLAQESKSGSNRFSKVA